MNVADALLERIRSRFTDDGCWSVSPDDLEPALGAVDLYRAVYQAQLVSRDRFGPENVGELLTILEAAGIPEAEAKFREAGIALNHHDRVMVTERFVRHLKKQTVLHLPRPEAFRAMIRDLRRYEIAEMTYCEEFLPIDPVVSACAAEHAEGRAHAEILVATIRRYLRSLVTRRYVLHQDVAPALFDLLRTVARQEGLLPPLSGRGGDTGREPVAEGDPQLSHALQVFGLDRLPTHRQDIQSAYRRLMRRYHPDINPDGLEMSKRINGAYAVLITSGGPT